MFKNCVHEVKILKLFLFVIPYFEKVYISTDDISEAIREGSKLGFVHSVKLHSCSHTINGKIKFFKFK